MLENGAGPTVMFRGYMDALPVKEITGLSYASAMVVKLPEGNLVKVGVTALLSVMKGS